MSIMLKLRLESVFEEPVKKGGLKLFIFLLQGEHLLKQFGDPQAEGLLLKVRGKGDISELLVEEVLP